MTDLKTIEKLELLTRLDRILRAPESTHEKDLYKGKLPPDLENKLEKLREDIRNKSVNSDNISPDQKKTVKIILLTHYLTYICNRQDSAKRVFDEGGYVFSRIVITFLKKQELPFDDWFRGCFNKEKLCFKAPGEDASKTFKARLMAEEAAGVYSFLKYLDEKGVNDRDYSSWQEDPFFGIFNETGNKAVEKIFKEFDKNTYNFEHFREKKSKRSLSEELRKFLDEKKSLFGRTNRKYEHKPHDRKRLWCCLRDFFYNSDFSDLLAAVIGQDTIKNFTDLEAQFELPGDVYNNDKTFTKCIWGDAFDIKTENFNSSEFIRKQYDDQKEKGLSPCWKPINYDVSFLYVQKMCRRKYCSICPMIGKDRYKELYAGCNKEYGDHLTHLCHKKKNTYCLCASAVLGAFHKCPGEAETSCQILSAINSLEGLKKLYSKRLEHLCHEEKGKYCVFVETALGIFYRCPGKCNLYRIMHGEDDRVADFP